MPKNFYARFRINVATDEATQRFINRLLNRIFENFFLYRMRLTENDAYHIKRHVIDHLGDRISGRFGYADLPTLIGSSDLYRVLQAVEGLYGTIEAPDLRAEYSRYVEATIADAETDLGIAWRNGEFLPAGAKLLDDRLVNDPLDWLRESGRDGVVQPLEKALHHLLGAKKAPRLCNDVITDAYEALEALVKIVTGRDRDLSGNRQFFARTIALPANYDRMLREYIDYGCQFRHGIGPDESPRTATYAEAEAFLYMTGIFLRLACSAIAR